MENTQIQFNDGAAYERYMGIWSQKVGQTFLTWLAPKPGMDWLDVGCGNGAFTEMISVSCLPSSVKGIDPSAAQLDFARSRLQLQGMEFLTGDAMALPYSDAAFDVAVMPLVIFFVPVPEKGVAEMSRVVKPGGLVTAYAWDLVGGGFPYAAMQSEMRAMNLNIPMPPRPEAGSMDVLANLWHTAGLEKIETKEIVVERTFESFDEYWNIILTGPSMGPILTAIAPEKLVQLKMQLREKLIEDAAGKITYSARANAIKGCVRW